MEHRAKRKTLSWKRKGLPASSKVPLGAPLHRVKSKLPSQSVVPTIPSGSKGTYDIGVIAPAAADQLISGWKDSGINIKYIEVRFFGSTPEGVALVHTDKGVYAFFANSEEASDDDFKELGFSWKKYGDTIGDSAAVGLIAPYMHSTSDSDLEEFKITEEKLGEIRNKYNDHSISINVGE